MIFKIFEFPAPNGEKLFLLNIHAKCIIRPPAKKKEKKCVKCCVSSVDGHLCGSRAATACGWPAHVSHSSRLDQLHSLASKCWRAHVESNIKTTTNSPPPKTTKIFKRNCFFTIPCQWPDDRTGRAKIIIRWEIGKETKNGTNFSRSHWILKNSSAPPSKIWKWAGSYCFLNEHLPIYVTSREYFRLKKVKLAREACGWLD